jgi:hypothetical protein
MGSKKQPNTIKSIIVRLSVACPAFFQGRNAGGAKYTETIIALSFPSPL